MAVWARAPDGFYENCPIRKCEFHTPDTGPHQVWAGTKLIAEFDDCPISHISDGSWIWLTAYTYLDNWNKGPADMGIAPGRVDPRYWDAMLMLRAEYRRMLDEARERRRWRNESGGQQPPHTFPGL